MPPKRRTRAAAAERRTAASSASRPQSNKTNASKAEENSVPNSPQQHQQEPKRARKEASSSEDGFEERRTESLLSPQKGKFAAVAAMRTPARGSLGKNEFRIPLHGDDLMQENGRFRAFEPEGAALQNLTDAAQRKLLDEAKIKMRLGARGAPNYPQAMQVANTLIVDEDRTAYNSLVTLLKGYAHLSDSLRSALLTACHAALVATVRCAEAVLGSANSVEIPSTPGMGSPARHNLPAPDGSHTEVATVRSALKMATFFLQWCISQAATHKSKTVKGSKPKSSHGRKAATARRARDDFSDDDEEDSAASSLGGQSNLSWESEGSQERILATLTQVLEINLSVLWQARAPEDEFMTLIGKVVDTMLEHPTMCRSIVIRRALGLVLALLVKRYHYSVTMRFEQSVLRYEHLCSTGVGGDHHVIADIVANMVKEHDCAPVLSEVLRQFGKLESHDLSSQGQKNVAVFLAAIAAAVPQRVLPHAAVLLPYLDDESYHMRNGVIDVIGHLLSFVAYPPSDLDRSEESNRETLTKTRESLFDTLQVRFLDSQRFTRSRVCKTYSRLIEEKAVPPERMIPILQAAVQRLNDTAAHTRKSAVILIQTMIEYNPFGPSLRLEEWRSKGIEFETQAAERTQLFEARLDELKKQAAILNEDEIDQQDAIKDLVALAMQQDEEMEGKQNFMIAFCTLAVTFIEMIQSFAMPKVTGLLRSSTPSDVLEALPFFALCQTFEIEAASEGMHRALALVWRDEPQVHDRLMRSFADVLLVPRGGFTGPAPTSTDAQLIHSDALAIANQLVEFANSGLTIGDLASFEHLLGLYVKAELEREDGRTKGDFYCVPPAVVTSLWEIFSTGGTYGFSKASLENAEDDAIQQSETTERARGALCVIAALAMEDADIVKERLRLLVKHAFAKSGNRSTASDLVCARSACVCLSRLAQTPGFARLSHKHALFQTFLSPRLFPGSFQRSMSRRESDFLDYCSLVEQCLNTIYALVDHPDKLATVIIKKWLEYLFPGSTSGTADLSAETVDPRALSVFFFIVGHTALKQVVHVEAVQTDYRRLRHQAELAAGKEREDDKVDQELEAIEQELGVHEAAAEHEQEQVQQTAEREIVSLHLLLGKVVPLLKAVLDDSYFLFGGTGLCPPGESSKHTRTILRESAALALSKLCCVDHKFCEDNLVFLFSVLASSDSNTKEDAYAFESSVRSNVVIALGDLSFRFPNLVEPWQPQMYSALLDADAGVRKNALLVLTHLLLNEMAKPKGKQVAIVAQCLVDSDPRIQEQAHLFFGELSLKTGGAAAAISQGVAPGSRAKKPSAKASDGPKVTAASASALRGSGVAIYNMLPDLLSTLCSDKRLPACSNDGQFKIIMRFLFSLLGRDKQTEVLTEKLCQRVDQASKEGNSVMQKRMAYCLASMKHNEKSIRVLFDNKALLAAAVRESEDVAESMIALITRSKANPQLKDALKATVGGDGNDMPLAEVLDKLAERVEQWRTGGDVGELEQAEMDRLTQNDLDEESALSAAKRPKPKRAAPKKAAARKRAPARRQEWSSSASDDATSTSSSSEEDSEPQVRSRPSTVRGKKPSAKRVAAKPRTRTAPKRSTTSRAVRRSPDDDDGSDSESE